jgi:flagellin-like hook-associated protein FlgL
MALNSINLTAGMRANLFSLQQTSRDFEITQKRLATGLRVNTALDDPINFFTAQEHRLRASDMASRKDGMSEAIQTIKAANVGIEGITNLLAQAKSLAQSALSAGTTDAISFASAYNTVMTQINEMAADSGYKGVNLLQSGELTVQFAPTADESTLHLSGFGSTAADFSISGMSDAGTGAGWVSGTDVSTSTIQSAIDGIETAIASLRTEAKVMSNNLVHQPDDQYAGRRCCQADRSRYERGRCQHADAANASGIGYDLVESGRSGRSGRFEIVLITIRIIRRGSIPPPYLIS